MLCFLVDLHWLVRWLFSVTNLSLVYQPNEIALLVFIGTYRVKQSL